MNIEQKLKDALSKAKFQYSASNSENKPASNQMTYQPKNVNKMAFRSNQPDGNSNSFKRAPEYIENSNKQNDEQLGSEDEDDEEMEEEDDEEEDGENFYEIENLEDVPEYSDQVYFELKRKEEEKRRLEQQIRVQHNSNQATSQAKGKHEEIRRPQEGKGQIKAAGKDPGGQKAQRDSRKGKDFPDFNVDAIDSEGAGGYLNCEETASEQDEPQAFDFRLEIERRFKNSVVNKIYSFPRKYSIDQELLAYSSESSFESIKGVEIYDLRSQNYKNHLCPKEADGQNVNNVERIPSHVYVNQQKKYIVEDNVKNTFDENMKLKENKENIVETREKRGPMDYKKLLDVLEKSMKDLNNIDIKKYKVDNLNYQTSQKSGRNNATVLGKISPSVLENSQTRPSSGVSSSTNKLRNSRLKKPPEKVSPMVARTFDKSRDKSQSKNQTNISINADSRSFVNSPSSYVKPSGQVATRDFKREQLLKIYSHTLSKKISPSMSSKRSRRIPDYQTYINEYKKEPVMTSMQQATLNSFMQQETQKSYIQAQQSSNNKKAPSNLYEQAHQKVLNQVNEKREANHKKIKSFEGSRVPTASKSSVNNTQYSSSAAAGVQTASSSNVAHGGASGGKMANRDPPGFGSKEGFGFKEGFGGKEGAEGRNIREAKKRINTEEINSRVTNTFSEYRNMVSEENREKLLNNNRSKIEMKRNDNPVMKSYDFTKAQNKISAEDFLKKLQKHKKGRSQERKENEVVTNQLREDLNKKYNETLDQIYKSLQKNESVDLNKKVKYLHKNFEMNVNNKSVPYERFNH